MGAQAPGRVTTTRVTKVELLQKEPTHHQPQKRRRESKKQTQKHSPRPPISTQAQLINRNHQAAGMTHLTSSVRKALLRGRGWRAAARVCCTPVTHRCPTLVRALQLSACRRHVRRNFKHCFYSSVAVRLLIAQDVSQSGAARCLLRMDYLRDPLTFFFSTTPTSPFGRLRGACIRSSTPWKP